MEQPSTRRDLFSAFTVLLASLPFVGGLLVALRSGSAPAHSDKPARVPLCRLGDLKDDEIRQCQVSFQMRRGPKVESIARVVFVTRDPESREVLAMSGECTHLTCPVQLKQVAKNPDPGAPLQCPCHGGRFSRTGAVLAGPPPRPLRRLRIELPADGKGMIQLLEL
jgi:Rieske Fe-S protein